MARGQLGEEVAVVVGAGGRSGDWEGIRTVLAVTAVGAKGLLRSSVFMVPWSWN